ncbi:MAG: amino acid aminotransferase [Succinivibrionaceae bacterium]|nr:aspartate/tyrosine/aromatic aminotransferase [Ruminobacter sp.]MDY5780181.1 amino acid aminotransferase [Succinivibrionaceae bacterium]MEE1340852.1 amino acid aminotransferase [Succinivibrionaceae bacterium]
MFFEKIVAAPADPILGLTEEFKKDTRSNKINLGVGIYKTNEGNTPVLKCVKKAEEIILKNETTKSYLPIVGTPEYGALVRELVFGKDSAIIANNLARTCQAPGGTGALRIGADFLKQQKVTTKIWISDPTWANHFQVFGAAGIETGKYAYYDKNTHGLDFEGMKAALLAANEGDAVLLHACCHNPTGIDPTKEQWEELAKLCAEHKLLPFFDFAYQGFGNGIDEDAFGIRTFVKYNKEVLIASSFSKNFGLYNERIGALTIVSGDVETADKVFSQMKISVRSNISNPPAHGAKIVTTVLSDPELRAMWVKEVEEMRDRIKEMRELFVTKLSNLGVKRDFSFISQQYGMFSFSGLSKEQVARLKDEFGIYIVGSGRISVAGITTSNIDPLCEAIAKVL